MAKIKWSGKATNKEVFESIGENTMFLNNMLRRKVNLNEHLYDVIEGQIAEVKEVRKRMTQLLNVLRKRRRYWELEEEAEIRRR